MYKYYITSRWPSPGAMPKDGYLPDETVEYDERQYVPEIGRRAYAEIHYARPLTEKEISEYELVKAERR